MERYPSFNCSSENIFHHHSPQPSIIIDSCLRLHLCLCYHGWLDCLHGILTQLCQYYLTNRWKLVEDNYSRWKGIHQVVVGSWCIRIVMDSWVGLSYILVCTHWDTAEDHVAKWKESHFPGGSHFSPAVSQQHLRSKWKDMRLSFCKLELLCRNKRTSAKYGHSQMLSAQKTPSRIKSKKYLKRLFGNWRKLVL